jgi:hypothetical protein
MAEQSFTYVAKQPCGCLVMATVDHPGRQRDVAREVGKCIRAGFAVERVTSDEFRAMDWYCNEHRKVVAG